jgi:ABC-type nitrate/sulfonate/bicarbonate transport system substrate-binding protein
MMTLVVKRFAFGCIAVAAVLLAAASAYAQPVRIGSLGLSGPLLPLWIAQDKGLFAKQGLATELITFQGGTPTVQALLSGGIAFAATSTDTGANARLRGGDVVGIAEWVNSFPYMLVTSKDIDRGDKLKGKKIAISRFGGAAHYAARLSLGKLGLDAEKDVQMLQIGDESVRLTALRQRFVDATVLTPPTNLTARNLGFNVLVSLIDAGVKYSFDTVFTSRDYATRNRDTVLRFLRGFLSGVAYMKKNSADSIETLKKWTRSTDRAALEETYRIFGGIIPAKPYGTDEGWRNLLEVLSAADPKARQLETKDMFDYTYLTEIDKSGFIDALYK